MSTKLETQYCGRAQNQIHNNALTGTLPDSLSRWQALLDFDIGMNAFSGTLPDFIGSAWTQMESFTVSKNMLIGTVPSSVGDWRKTRAVGLADNLFTGTLPDAIGAWKALERLDVSSSWLRVLMIFLVNLSIGGPSRSPETYS